MAGARQTLQECSIPDSQIFEQWVPGSFELPLGAQLMFDALKVDAVVCLGSVIRGETAHFDFVCETCAQGIKDVSLKLNKPAVFGVLTDDHIEQSRDRSGGKHGNKGSEAAITAVKMAILTKNLYQSQSGSRVGFNQ